MKNDNITRVNFAGLAMEFTPEKVTARWQDFSSSPLAEQVQRVCGDAHWMIHGLSLNVPSEIFLRFWKAFDTPKCEKARAVAVIGLKNANHQEAIHIVEEAKEFDERRRLAQSEYAQCCAWTFASRLSEAIVNGNVLLMKQILAVMEAEKQKASNPNRRGGSCSEDGYMFQQFTKLHAESRSLPSKAQLRRACGLNNLEDKKTADDRMKKLGLWGLPTEAEK